MLAWHFMNMLLWIGLHNADWAGASHLHACSDINMFLLIWIAQNIEQELLICLHDMAWPCFSWLACTMRTEQDLPICLHDVASTCFFQIGMHRADCVKTKRCKYISLMTGHASWRSKPRRANCSIIEQNWQCISASWYHVMHIFVSDLATSIAKDTRLHAALYSLCKLNSNWCMC